MDGLLIHTIYVTCTTILARGCLGLQTSVLPVTAMADNEARALDPDDTLKEHKH